MPFRKGEIKTIIAGRTGSNRQRELYPRIYSEMGKKSKFYENKIANRLKNKFDHFFVPNEVCDRIAIKNNQLVFIEIKRNERHNKLTEKQLLFKQIINNIKGIKYNLIIK